MISRSELRPLKEEEVFVPFVSSPLDSRGVDMETDPSGTVGERRGFARENIT